MNAQDYKPAPDVALLVRELRDYHSGLKMHPIRVRTEFVPKLPKYNGREPAGRIVTLTGREAALLQNTVFPSDRETLYFQIEISEPVWTMRSMTEERRAFVIDCLLSLCDVGYDAQDHLQIKVLKPSPELLIGPAQRHGIQHDAGLLALVQLTAGQLDGLTKTEEQIPLNLDEEAFEESGEVDVPLLAAEIHQAALRGVKKRLEEVSP